MPRPNHKGHPRRLERRLRAAERVEAREAMTEAEKVQRRLQTATKHNGIRNGEPVGK